jgi:hypothetical protein
MGHQLGLAPIRTVDTIPLRGIHYHKKPASATCWDRKGETEMERWLLIAETSCIDPSREKEFNHWYNNIHVPDILETPGFIRATRYENSMPAEDRGKFLALYEVETENLPQTMAAFTENVTRKWQEGRMSELLKPISAILYRQITASTWRK